MTGDDHIRSTLLGLAWGDALGSPVEGWRDDDIRSVFGDFQRLPDEYPFERIAALGRKRLRRLRPLGLYSDDTQQALALIQVCLGPGGWSSAGWSDLLTEGMRRKAWRGYGRNFAYAVGQLRRGCPPSQSGSPSAGIGACMRITPLAAIYRDAPDALARVAWESSLVTHGDIRAGAVAYAVAWAAAAFLAGQSAQAIRTALPDAVATQEKEWLEGHADWTIARSGGHTVSQALRELFRDPSLTPAQVRELVSCLARPHLPPEMTAAHPNQGFALLGGLHALARALGGDIDPSAVLADVVCQGYDTDTVAAICGGLLGARCGSGWIPRERLLDHARLESYAAALVHRGGLPEDRATFLQREADWTRRECEYQQALAARSVPPETAS
jgi:ADP-ribosylglycohydrolase